MPNIKGTQETQEFKIEKLDIIPSKGKKLDVSGIYTALTINESIFENYISGEIELIDTSSIIESLPILGEEKIEIVIGYPGHTSRKPKKEIKLKGNIYKLDNRKRNNGGQTVEEYTLYFCDEIRLKDKIKRVSKTFKENKISDYVTKILEEELGVKAEVEKTEGKYELNIPNLSPIKSINFLSNFAYKQKGDDNFFLFYQDREKYHFKSIEKMIEERNGKETIIYFDKLVNFNNHKESEAAKEAREAVNKRLESISKLGVMGANLPPGMAEALLAANALPTVFFPAPTAIAEDESEKPLDVYQCEDYEFNAPFSNYESSDTGYFGFTNYSTDILTKTLHKIEYNYSEKFSSMKNLNGKDTKEKEYEINQNPIDTKIYSKSTTKGRSESEYIKEILKESDLLVDHFTETRDPLKNTKKERLAMGPSFNVKIPGNLKIMIGDVLEVHFPSYKPEGKERRRKYEKDKYYSGSYLVGSITHTFSRQNLWNCSLNLLSDSLTPGKTQEQKKTPQKLISDLFDRLNLDGIINIDDFN